MRPDIYAKLAELEARLEQVEQRERMHLQPSTVDAVTEAVAHASGVPRAEIVSRARHPHVAEARAMCWRLLFARGHSKSSIARAFNRNHATVIYHLNKPAPAALLARAERLLA